VSGCDSGKGLLVVAPVARVELWHQVVVIDSEPRANAPVRGLFFGVAPIPLSDCGIRGLAIRRRRSDPAAPIP
jgi:hypothetical protein